MQTLPQLIANEIFASEKSYPEKEIRVKCQVKKALMDLEEEYVRLAKIYNEEENEKVSEERIDILNDAPLIILDDGNQHITILDNFKSEDFYKVFTKNVIPNRIEMYTNYKVTVA